MVTLTGFFAIAISRSPLSRVREMMSAKPIFAPRSGAGGEGGLSLCRDAPGDLAELPDDLLVGERLGFLTQLGDGLGELDTRILGQLVGRVARRAKLGVVAVERLALLFAQLRDALRPLDPASKLVEVVVEEDDGRDRLVLALFEVLVHQVFVLIAQ